MERQPPRVFLGNLEPISRIGLAAVLTDAGVDVVAQEQIASRIVSEVGRLEPDAVVLDRDDPLCRTLCARVREASPNTKVILWARDETLMEVIDPGSKPARLAVPEDLHSELSAGSSANLVEE